MFNQEQYGTESPGFQGVPAPALFPRGLPVDRLETVYRYVAAGFPILPCEPQAKVPSLPRGFKDATTDIQPYDHPRLKGYAKVTLHHDKFKLISARNNLAIEPGRIGCTVVDIDPKNGGHKTWNALIAEHGPIATRKVRTPSGGWHLWFSGTISTVNRKLGPGIDTRCFGGYVLLPPSSVKGRRYEWVDETVPIASLPDWAREIAEAQTEGPATRRTRRGHPNGEGADATEDDAAALEEAFDTWKAAGGDGGRFEYLLSRIGDEESGGDGFADAMTRALGHAARAGMPLDEAVARIAGAARAAPPGNRTSPYIEEKIFQLRGAFKRFRAQDAAQEEEVRKVAEEAEAAARAPEEEEVAEQPRPFSGSSEWVPPEDAIASLRKPIQTWLERDSTHRKTLTVLQSAAGLGKSQTMVEEQQRAEWADRQRAKEDEGSDLAKLQRIVADLVENLHGEADPTKQYLIKTELEKQQDLFVAELLKENLANLPPPPLGKLACAVPRQKLAQEIQEVDRKRRQAEGAEGQIPILAGRNSSNCQRYELVAKAQKKGFEPSALCHQTLPSGEEVYCPFYEKCSTDPTQYLANQTEVN